MSGYEFLSDLVFSAQKRCVRFLFGKKLTFDHAGYYETCPRVRSYQLAPKNYCLEHTKPIFNENNILNVSNLYIHQTFVSMFKIMKDHSPIAIYDIFNFSLRNNFLLILPSFRLNLSQYNFVNRCSLLWNKFIGKVMEKNKPEIDGKLIPGTTENSDCSGTLC